MKIPASWALADGRYDIAAHNAEVESLWLAYAEGRPWRVPVIFGVNTRYYMLDQSANEEKTGFRAYSEDPETMMLTQLRFALWSRFNLLQDTEIGLPDGWDVRVDFQNYYEAAWFGCKVEYIEGEVPDTLPAFSDDEGKRRLFERGLPDPFGGLMERNWRFYEHMKKRQREGFTFFGRPIRSVTPSGIGTDGPLTVACNIRGASQVFLDLLADPSYARDLLGFITEATISRIRAYRQAMGEPVVRPSFGFADDSVQSLSTDLYSDMVLPFHKRLIATFADPAAPPFPVDPPKGQALLSWGPKRNSIHLCGDASRLFPLIKKELNVFGFDTGFPIDFGMTREALGEDVTIQGGPHVELLRQGPPDRIKAEVKRILESGVTRGRQFILREANNLAPLTPLENLRALYDAARELGTYEVKPS